MKLFKTNLLKRSSMLTIKTAKKCPNFLYNAAYLYLAVLKGNMANTTESYRPDTGKLVTKAAQSKDLYVEPDFNFQTFRLSKHTLWSYLLITKLVNPHKVASYVFILLMMVLRHKDLC